MIRVIIERHLKEDRKGEFIHLLRELRTAAIHQPGYISGETMASIEDASIISVLSTWQSLNDWKNWQQSNTRTKLEKQIETLLMKSPKVSVYKIMATD